MSVIGDISDLLSKVGLDFDEEEEEEEEGEKYDKFVVKALFTQRDENLSMFNGRVGGHADKQPFLPLDPSIIHHTHTHT